MKHETAKRRTVKKKRANDEKSKIRDERDFKQRAS